MRVTKFESDSLLVGPVDIDLILDINSDRLHSIEIDSTFHEVNMCNENLSPEDFHRNSEKSGLSDLSGGSNKSIYNALSFWASFISIIVAIFGIGVPLHSNNILLERSQADKIFHYIVKSNESCGSGDTANASDPEAANRWKICIRNPSEAPIYEVKTMGKMIDNYTFLYSQQEKNLGYGIGGTVTVWQIMPGESKGVWELDQDLSIGGKSVSGETHRIDVEYQFKDNKGIIWNGKYSFKNLDDKNSGAEFVRDTPLEKGGSPNF